LPFADVVVIRLVRLAEVRRVRVRNGAFRPHPVQRGARVEAARKRDADSLADREILQDARHERRLRAFGKSVILAFVLSPETDGCNAATPMSSHTTFERARDAVADGNTATLTACGPVDLRGDLVLIGGVARHDTRLTLCRCGGSANKPFCDGTHVKTRFADDGALRAPERQASAAPAGRVEIRARHDGPLMLTGPLTVVGTNGRTAFSETTFLCRCGASRNKPYCDGTHVKTGFMG
jgi:CDGSH-type Zn-finger protein